MNRRPYKYRLQLQITGYFILLVVLVINSVSWFLYYRTNRFLENGLETKLKSVASYTTGIIEADLLRFLTPGDEGGGFYTNIQKRLLDLQLDFDCSRIFLIKPDGETVVDTDRDGRIGEHIPYLMSQASELEEVRNGRVRATTLFRGVDGLLYKSAYAPILNTAGEVTLLAGVEASPAFLQTMDQLRTSILFINSISLVAAVLLGILLARSIVNPVNRLVESARQIGRGDYSGEVDIPSQNEIGYLGDVFNGMRENIMAAQLKLKDLRQQAEVKAQRIQTYNDYILDSISNGIISIDLQGSITVMNPEAARILRLSQIDGDAGIHWTKAVPETHPIYKMLTQVFQSAPTGILTEARVDFQNETVYLAYQSSPLRDTAGIIIGRNLLLLDVTELRILQEEVREKERLAYLGELSAAVAHEIRNPLNSIQLLTGLIEKHLPAGSQQKQNLLTIRDEINDLNRIVTNFLTFARPPEIVQVEVSIQELVENSLMLAKQEIQKKQIIVDVSISDFPITVPGDFFQLKQAILNLILNAVQAMDTGGRLSIHAEIGRDDPKWIELMIEDNGDGIPESELDEIFKPFYSTRAQGTGLGLAIVKNIIDAHGGRIRFSSEPDKGTAARIDLPGQGDLS